MPSQSHVQSVHIVEPVNVRELKEQIGTTTSAASMPFGEATSNASAHANMEQIPTAYPSCCTVEQYDYFTKEHNWITVSNGKLGCSVCKTLGSLGASTVGVEMKVRLASEWVYNAVGAYGRDRCKELKSLRKKISEHQNSSGHLEAVKVKEVRDQEALHAAVQTQTANQHAATCHIFNTAYHIAKKNRLFSDHIDLIKLQEVNGVDMDRVLHSNVVCTDIVDHICFEM